MVIRSMTNAFNFSRIKSFVPTNSQSSEILWKMVSFNQTHVVCTFISFLNTGYRSNEQVFQWKQYKIKMLHLKCEEIRNWKWLCHIFCKQGLDCLAMQFHHKKLFWFFVLFWIIVFRQLYMISLSLSLYKNHVTKLTIKLIFVIAPENIWVELAEEYNEYKIEKENLKKKTNSNTFYFLFFKYKHMLFGNIIFLFFWFFSLCL